jgi:hypothetical protein
MNGARRRTEVSMEGIIIGRIKSTDSDQATLGECRVEVFFEQKAPEPKKTALRAERYSKEVDVSPPEKSGPGRTSARTDSTGSFKLTIPGETELASNTLYFVVSGPAGQLIGEAKRNLKEALDNLVIPVTTKELIPIPLATPENLPKETTRRISGRVLDRKGKSVPANAQVLLFARKSSDGEEDASGMPVMVARTDGSGYFFGEAPNDEFEKAAALIAGIPTEVAITLDSGYIPKKLILLVDLPESAAAGSDVTTCGGGVTPRTPSHADIENAPDTYSTDLGTGRCVEFNTPNRAIEEFDFYTVVRTTEPDIVGFTAAGQTTSGTAVSNGTLAALTAALATAERIATAATEEANAATLNATKTRAGVSDIQALDVAFNAIANNPNGRVKQAVEDALTKKGTANWSETGIRGVLATVLVSEGLSPTIAEKIAETLLNAVMSLPPSELDETHFIGTFSRAHYAADSIVIAAAQGARAAAAAVEIKVAAANAAAAAASARAAEATRAVEAARAAEAAKKNEIAAQALLQARKAQTKPRGRGQLNASNPVDWDDTPTFYQAAEIAHGHLLHFKQIWYADGYSLGDLLYSLPLAPGQKKLISVVDWERRERTERTEDTFSNEGVNAALSRDRDLGEVVTGALTESSRGGSKSTSAGVGVGTGAAGNGSYQGFNFGALIGVSGGYGESNSSAWQDSARNLSSTSLQNLRDRTLQSASAIRGLRSSVVHTVAQGEAVRATTEVVANHNHCHAVTIQYFEVLRHLKLQHELAGVQECLFVPLPMSEFDLAKALRWRQELRTYLQRPQLAGGFDAARRVQTHWSQVDSPLDRYADEYVLSLSGELLITILIPLPPFPERPKPKPEDTAANTAQAIADAVNPTTGPLGVLLAIATGGVSLIAGAVTTATINATKEAAKGARAMADELYEASPQERYDKFHHDIVPGVVAGFIDQLELWALVGGTPVPLQGVDFTLASEYQPGIPLLVSVRATLSGQQRRSEISQLIIKSVNGLPPTFRAIVNSATIRYRTSTFEHSFVDDRKVNDDIDPPKAVALFTGLFDYEIKTISVGRGATLFTPIDAWEQRSPRTEDRRLAAELVEHLNDNLEYYHHAIWWAMDPNRRYMLLDGYYAPGSNNRSVASVVENRLIGIIGNSVILPVAHGIQLDPRFKADAEGNIAELMEFYRLDAPMPASRVSLPTRGIFAEAVMGACNSCEKIDDSRFWRWEESPIDEPPSIEPISTATRRSEPATVTPSSFPTPIVSIQNAPSVPDPVGVRAALDALGKQSFADITGLAGTQANAAAAYQQALDTAYKFGKEASTLAQQAAMLGAKDKALGAIDSAEESGKIDASDAKQLRLSALKKMVGDSPVDDKASTVADRLAVIDKQEATGGISSEAATAARERIMRGLDPESAAGNDEQSAATDAIKRIPSESLESVQHTAASGATTSVTAKAAGAQAQGNNQSVFDESEVDRPISADVSEKCFGAFATAGPGFASALGVIAHIMIEADAEKSLNVERGYQLFVDDQFAGKVNPKYVKFLLMKNPNLSPAKQNIIRQGGYARPDFLLHDGQKLEFDEIKPNSITGRKDGLIQIKKISAWMNSLGLPYLPGSTYAPHGKIYIPILTFKLASFPIEVVLEVERTQAGLILYKYCIRADWSKLVKGAVVAAIIALLAFIIARIGVPGPLPIPMPVPRLPDPTPIIVLPPIPQPIVVEFTEVTLSHELLVAREHLSEDQGRNLALFVEQDIPQGW